MAITLDPAQHNASIILSNGDLTATGSSFDWGFVRATEAKAYNVSGRYYFEVLITKSSGDNIIVGLESRLTSYNYSLPTDGFSFDTDGILLSRGYNYSYNDTGSSVASGSVIMVAYALNYPWDNYGSIWFGVNGTWLRSGDPANNTGMSGLWSTMYGGTLHTSYGLYPAVAPLNSSSASATVRFRSSDFTYSIPSGFTAYDTSSAPPVEYTAPVINLDFAFHAPTYSTTTVGYSILTSLQDYICTHLLRTSSWTKPTTLYFGLLINIDPIVEVPVFLHATYARKAVTCNGTNWQDNGDGTFENLTSIDFAAMTETVVGWALYLTDVATDPILVKEFAAPIEFLVSGDPPAFAPGDMVFTVL